MTITFNSFQALLFPFVIIFGLVGLRRGFWREVGITGGIALVVLGTVIFPDSLLGFINRVITNIPRVFGVLLGADVDALPSDLLFGEPGTGRYLLARFVLFALLTFLVYGSRPGWALDAGKPRAPRSGGQRILGAVFGGITGFLWFIALNDFVNALRALRADPVIPPEGTTLQVQPVDLTPLLAFVPTLVAIVLIILLVLAFLRLPNLWR